MMRTFGMVVTACAVLAGVSWGQEVFSGRIMGLRVTGNADAGFPVVVEGSGGITIEFDTNDEHPADYRLKFYHCDTNWEKTASSFINDELRNMTRSPLAYERSPLGTRNYQWHYTVQLPGHPDVPGFAYSGNYIFELWDEEDEEMLARGVFFVVEQTVTPAVRVANRQEPSAESPLNQVHRVDVQFGIPDIVQRQTGGFGGGNGQQEVLMPLFFTTVDVYRNREVYYPYRIDSNELSSATFVEGIGTRRMRFMIDNILAGNEYRRLDVRNIGQYPEGSVLRQREGADVLRASFRTPRDRNGLSEYLTNDRYADYVEVRFEYLDEEKYAGDEIYVVGDFNGWLADESSLMTYDPELKRFFHTVRLRRGAYDYQYVLGENWVALEGNDWRTVNVYSAFVYYHDDRYGGYDRIVGFVQGRSTGRNAPEEY